MAMQYHFNKVAQSGTGMWSGRFMESPKKTTYTPHEWVVDTLRERKLLSLAVTTFVFKSLVTVTVFT
jgi:hypothetical protein